MTASNLTPEDAIRFALLLNDGAPTPAFVLKAIRLAGYEIVPAGAAPGAGAKPPPPPPVRGPVLCVVCNKIRNNGGDDDCDNDACPF